MIKKRNMTTSSIGIIGVGNPLRKDDGIGIILLQRLKEESNTLPKIVSFIDAGTGGMNLLHILNKFDVVILLDAVNFQGKPGETRFFSFDEIQSKKQISTFSTHDTDLFHIIRISRELDECTSKVFIFGVQPANVNFGKGLSNQIQRNINGIVETMKKNVHDIIRNTD